MATKTMETMTESPVLGEILRRESKLTMQSFIEDPNARIADTQLVHCLEGIMKEEDLDPQGRLVHFYEDDEISRVPESPDIEEQYKLLNEQYEEFLQQVRKDTDGDTRKRHWKRLFRRDGQNSGKEIIKDDTKQDQKATNIEDVKKAVLDAQQEWATKSRLLNGKAQLYLHKFCSTLQNHSNLFDMLPNQSQYFSMFCGSVKTLIKASVNHRKIADDLAESLSRISDDIDLCVNTLKVWPMNEIRKAVGQLCSYIFHFLRSAMKWYQSRSWKKVLDALNENFLASFQSTLSSIELLKSRILSTTALKSQAELKDVHVLLQQVARTERDARVAQMKMWYSIDAKMEERHARLEERFLELSRSIGVSVQTQLDSNFQAIKSTVVRRPTARTAAKIAAVKTKPKQKTLSTTRTYTRDALQRWSRHLEKNMTPMADVLETTEASADTSVAVALEQWSQSATSESLWIRGYDEDIYPSSTSKIAAAVAAKALQVGVPLLGFFCDCRNPGQDIENEKFASPEDREELEMAVVINFAYTLIRQAIGLLPTRIESPLKFSKSRFAKLDGTLASWDDALKILGKLLKLAPQAIVVVVDGIENLDQSGLEEYVDDILALLSRSGEEGDGNARILKVLFTTAGACSALEKMDDVEVVAPSPVRSRRIRGRGRRSLELSF